MPLQERSGSGKIAWRIFSFGMKLSPALPLITSKDLMILFRRFGLFFLPVHWAGWLLTLAAIGYTVWSFIDIDSRSHSVSDTLMNTVFTALIAAVAYSVIAFFFSSKETGK
jgi:cation transport ATPase